MFIAGSRTVDSPSSNWAESNRRAFQRSCRPRIQAKDSLLCSNDPVCAEHNPDAPHETRPLQGAACHGCLLIAETSCEQRNDFLDRALVVPTVGVSDAAFFDGVNLGP